MRDPVETDLGLEEVASTPLRQLGYVKALCCDDRCPWKHVAGTWMDTFAAAEKHVKRSGHAVTIDLTLTQTVRPTDA